VRNFDHLGRGKWAWERDVIVGVRHFQGKSWGERDRQKVGKRGPTKPKQKKKKKQTKKKKKNQNQNKNQKKKKNQNKTNTKQNTKEQKKV